MIALKHALEFERGLGDQVVYFYLSCDMRSLADKPREI